MQDKVKMAQKRDKKTEKEGWKLKLILARDPTNTQRRKALFPKYITLNPKDGITQLIQTIKP